MTADRAERGIAAYAQIFSVPASQVSAVFAARVGPVFAGEALQAAGGGAWSDPSLTDRDRSIAVVTALACQGISDDRLRTHVRLAQENGLDAAALTALMILLATYAGYPRASLAMETLQDVTRVGVVGREGVGGLPNP